MRALDPLLEAVTDARLEPHLFLAGVLLLIGLAALALAGVPAW